MSEDNCLCVNWRGRNAYLIDIVSFTIPLTHSRLLQHYIICVGCELDCTALVEESTKFLQNTNHIAPLPQHRI
jgi:hypothetical protein